MGYLDYAGLQYLWGKLKEKFAPKSHTHDDRYYTESEMDGKLNSKVDNNETGANSLLSKLNTSWTAAPTDDTYFIRQDTSGTNTFGRLKFSTVWSYIKSKADSVYQPKGSYAAADHNHDSRYYTESEMDGKLNAKLSLSGGTMTGPIKFASNDALPVRTGQDFILGIDSYADGGTMKYSAASNVKVGAATKADTADNASHLSGLSTRTNQTWGNQTGTFVHGEDDSTGGSFAFRRDCPSGGQMSMIIDGRFYQNEGKYRVLDTSDAAGLTVGTANMAKTTYINVCKTVNLSSLNVNTWYPVVGSVIPYTGFHQVRCNVHLNSSTKPSWSTHGSGFTAVVDILTTASGWGTTAANEICLQNNQRFISDTSKPPVGYQQLINASVPVFWLRGGGNYHLYTDWDCGWSIKTSSYTANQQTVAPTTTYPGVNIIRSTVTANLNGNASSASTATVSAKLGRGGNTSTPMTFNWSGQSGQPTWLWGGSDGTNMYVYNPSNFNVNYAASAGSVAWANVSGKPSTYTPASHTHNYAGSSSAGGTANSVNGYTFQVSTTDLTAGSSSLATNKIYIVYE